MPGRQWRCCLPPWQAFATSIERFKHTPQNDGWRVRSFSRSPSTASGGTVGTGARVNLSIAQNLGACYSEAPIELCFCLGRVQVSLPSYFLISLLRLSLKRHSTDLVASTFIFVTRRIALCLTFNSHHRDDSATHLPFNCTSVSRLQNAQAKMPISMWAHIPEASDEELRKTRIDPHYLDFDPPIGPNGQPVTRKLTHYEPSK